MYIYKMYIYNIIYISVCVCVCARACVRACAAPVYVYTSETSCITSSKSVRVPFIYINIHISDIISERNWITSQHEFVEAFSTAMDRMQRQSGCSRTASDQSSQRRGGGEAGRDSCFRSLEEPPSLPPSPPLQGKGRERDEEVIVCVCVRVCVCARVRVYVCVCVCVCVSPIHTDNVSLTPYP
jgi:hypothetical protein